MKHSASSYEAWRAEVIPHSKINENFLIFKESEKTVLQLGNSIAYMIFALSKK